MSKRRFRMDPNPINLKALANQHLEGCTDLPRGSGFVEISQSGKTQFWVTQDESTGEAIRTKLEM